MATVGVGPPRHKAENFQLRQPNQSLVARVIGDQQKRVQRGNWEKGRGNPLLQEQVAAEERGAEGRKPPLTRIGYPKKGECCCSGKPGEGGRFYEREEFGEGRDYGDFARRGSGSMGAGAIVGALRVRSMTSNLGEKGRRKTKIAGRSKYNRMCVKNNGP